MPVESKLVPVNSQAPNFGLEAADGKRIQLSDYVGKKHVVLILLRGFF